MVTIFVYRKGNFYFYIYQRLQVTYTTFKISIVEVLGLLQMIWFHKNWFDHQNSKIIENPLYHGSQTSEHSRIGEKKTH